MYINELQRFVCLFRFERISLNPSTSQVVSFDLSSADFEYFGVDGWYTLTLCSYWLCTFLIQLFNYRKLMESGEFRVAIGHDVDCRTNPEQCVSFELQTSSGYAPACDYGCRLWASGALCGQTQSEQQCLDTCRQQQWSWEYIGCLEEYAAGDCSKAVSSECLDAFGETQSDTLASSCSGYTKDSEVRLYLALGIVFGALGGAALMAVAAYFYTASSAGRGGPMYDKLMTTDNSIA
jgi:hypothetical protein